MSKLALAIHGGAGTILRSQMTPDLEREYKSGVEAALKAGWQILSSGGSSLDAVEAAVVELENFPLFNAGRGAVFTAEGKNEMDAAIMDGQTLKAGAVAFVKNIKNPIRVARLVMEQTEHVLLAGEGANRFAAELGVETAPDEYFFTEHRWLQLQDAIAAGRVQLDHSARVGEKESEGVEETELVSNYADQRSKVKDQRSLGTVGAVACDVKGHLAAATSTGGMTNKKFGRIGDTPVIGSGTYADDLCAVSCTGHGEFFMLGVSAYDVAARMRYKDISLDAAANETISRLTKIGGEGGLIAVDAHGNIALPFNSEGMYRGSVTSDGVFNIEIYK
ncbi:MAG: isoaspartyl peptidase/L-asparaginase [Acidobacteria bacterium]|nr:isoaspartyl peptidase/L-asparaginase [Acidobacteriota bacterium]